MPDTLVDSSVLLDILSEDPVWFDWSADRLAEQASATTLVINPVIYAEVSVSFTAIEDLEAAVSPEHFRRDPLPWEAAFLAGKVFLRYRRAGGARHAPLPDFFIGAHAAIEHMTLLTRDPRRVRTHFPHVRLIAPVEGERPGV